MPPLQAAGLLLAVAAFGGLGAQLGVGDIISDIIGKKINYRAYEPFADVIHRAKVYLNFCM